MTHWVKFQETRDKRWHRVEVRFYPTLPAYHPEGAPTPPDCQGRVCLTLACSDDSPHSSLIARQCEDGELPDEPRKCCAKCRGQA